MRGSPLKFPRIRWRKGQVLRLSAPVCGIRPGSFVFLGQTGDTFTVRRLIEDGAGDLCATDESHDLSIEHADYFVPAMSIGCRFQRSLAMAAQARWHSRLTGSGFSDAKRKSSCS